MMNKKERLKCVMPMTGNNNSSDKVAAANDIIENNIFILRDLYDIHIDISNGWLTESNSRILRRRMHTHVFLSDFTRAYAETKNEVYFTESFKLLEDWFERFPANKRDELEELAYHPEGTSIRLLFWLKYYNQFYNLFDEQQQELFNNKIDENAELLYQDSFYAGMTNHGMFQNMGLLAYTLFRYEDFFDNELFNKAIKRITHYFSEVFTSEGVHKEHSPSYHVLLVHSLKQILETLELANYSDEKVDILKSIFDKAANYTTNIVTPDFKLPNISDGTQFNMSTSGVYKSLFENEEYKFITSAGKEGIEPSPLVNIYPDSGYLVARDSWQKDATYFLFLASYHMHFHKHTDDLSFILHKNGPIFIDAGPYSYDYKDPFTQYAYSQYAHSTLIINNHSLPRTDHKFDDVQIINHEVNHEEQSFVVEGMNNRYSDASHTRKIIGDLKSGTFDIIDKVLSEKPNQYKILFQINGDLDVLQNGNIISVFKNNAKVAELEVENYSGINGLSMYIVTEQKFPQIMGYQFPKIEHIKPAKTLVIECYNNISQAKVKTKIRLNDYKIKGNVNFSRRNELKRFRDISYIYEHYKHDKLAVIFSSTENEYNYKLDEFPELSKKGFNVLYLLDSQSKVGRSFLQGESSSTIESDVLSVLNNIINENNIEPMNVYLFGRSKGGFAALYYALTSGYNNIFISTPLLLIGDYYTRHEKFEPIIKDLGLDNEEQLKYYLNDYFSGINISKPTNINICIGENDYHKKKHVDYLIKWLNAENINHHLHIYPNAEFKDDKVEFIKFLNSYNFD